MDRACVRALAGKFQFVQKSLVLFTVKLCVVRTCKLSGVSGCCCLSLFEEVVVVEAILQVVFLVYGEMMMMLIVSDGCWHALVFYLLA